MSPHRLQSLGTLFKNVKDRVVLFNNTVSSVCERVTFCVYDRKIKWWKSRKLVNLASWGSKVGAEINRMVSLVLANRRKLAFCAQVKLIIAKCLLQLSCIKIATVEITEIAEAFLPVIHVGSQWWAYQLFSVAFAVCAFNLKFLGLHNL